MLISHLSLFYEMPILFFCLFFNWVVCLLIIHLLEFFYMFWIPFLVWSDMICKYFLCGLSFQFLNSVFWGKFAILMKSNLSLFFSMSYAFGVISTNSLPNPRSWSFFYAFFQIFIVLALTFRFIINFELIFCTIVFVRKYIFSHMDASFFRTMCLKDDPLFIE